MVLVYQSFDPIETGYCLKQNKEPQSCVHIVLEIRYIIMQRQLIKNNPWRVYIVINIFKEQ